MLSKNLLVPQFAYQGEGWGGKSLVGVFWRYPFTGNILLEEKKV